MVRQRNPTLIMKKHILVPIVLGGLITFSLTTQAQDRPGQGGRGGEGGRGGANPREGIREAMIKKFDKNGDGKLDEDERPSREEMQEFFRAQLGGGQTRPGGGQTRPGGRPGEGRTSGRPEERGGGVDREKMRTAFIKKFDKNGDGELDENERPSREEREEFFRAQLGGGQGGPGQGRQGAGEPGQGRPGQGGEFSGRGQGGRGGFRPSNPVMEAIDKNKDGALSADELKNAAKALAALDKNKDGKIDQEEMRPQFDRGQGGREGFRRPGQGGQGGREGFRRPGQGGEGRPGAGSRENPRGPREGDRNQPRPKRGDA